MMLPVLFSSIVVVLCSCVLYSYYVYSRKKEKLKWIKLVPGWPLIGAALEFGDNTRIISDLQRLSKTYGKLIQTTILMQSIVMAVDYDFVEFILSKHEILNKSKDYKYFNKWLGTGLLTSDGQKWRKRRKLITPAFHFNILEQFIDIFEHNLKILLSQLKKEVGKDSVDIYSFINLYTLDVICETAMGVSINAQKDKKSNYVKNVKELCRIMTERSFSVLKQIECIYPFFPDCYKEMKLVKEIHHITNTVIDTRRKELELKKEEKTQINDETEDVGRKKRMTFLDILLQSNVEGNPLSTEDIREEVDTFMFEGHDTVSSAMSFTLYLLAKHPEVQKRVLEEQNAIFDSDIYRSSTYNDLQAMKYLEMVIKESLRLYPSVSMIGRKTHADVEYKGRIIPKDVDLLIFIYGLLRDPDNFDNPDEFHPERFENNDGTRPYSFIPFSAGPRNCIGQKFAMLELKSTLSGIVRNFELVPPTPGHEMILVSEIVLKSINGVRVKLIERKRL